MDATFLSPRAQKAVQNGEQRRVNHELGREANVTNELMTVDGGALTEAQQAVLTQKTPTNVVKQRKGPGGKMLSYVPHAWVTATLNQAFGWAWSWDVQEWRLVPDGDPREVFVLGKLTVHTQNGDLVKSQFGSATVKRSRTTNEPLSIGDDLKAASSDALKKSSSLLGLALDLYGSDLPTNGSTVQSGTTPGKPSNGTGGTFKSVDQALQWAKDRGAFEHLAHARNAYEKVKRENNPESAQEMATFWREEVEARAQEAYG